MTNELANKSNAELSTAVEQVVIEGDLSKLSPEQRVEYYRTVCGSVGLNPYTRPFDYIRLNGKLTLYARKDATDQLRKIHGVNIDDIQTSDDGEWYVVTVKGSDREGRRDVEIGAVNKKDMQGNVGNSMMKAVTKAKRRLTLSLCGLGWLDETEVETIPDAKPVIVDDNGVIEAPKATVEKPVLPKKISFDEAQYLSNWKDVDGIEFVPPAVAGEVQDKKGRLLKDIPTEELANSLDVLKRRLQRVLDEDTKKKTHYYFRCCYSVLSDRASKAKVAPADTGDPFVEVEGSEDVQSDEA